MITGMTSIGWKTHIVMSYHMQGKVLYIDFACKYSTRNSLDVNKNGKLEDVTCLMCDVNYHTSPSTRAKIEELAAKVLA